jgi:hypothetical protein
MAHRAVWTAADKLCRFQSKADIMRLDALADEVDARSRPCGRNCWCCRVGFAQPSRSAPTPQSRSEIRECRWPAFVAGTLGRMAHRWCFSESAFKEPGAVKHGRRARL